MVATSFDLSQIRTDATAYSSSFRNLIGLGSSATLNAASANGVATLDGTGKLSAAQIPDISLVSYLGSVASQAAMLALPGQQGDWCVRSDLSTTWVITGNDPTQLTSWTQLSYPAVPVQSVFGRTGAVVGVSTDYSAVGIDSTAIGAVTPSTGAFTTLSGTKATISTGTITASTPALDASQTWNNAAVTFTGSKINITDTASASGSLLADWQVGGVKKASVRKDGMMYATGYEMENTGGWGTASSAPTTGFHHFYRDVQIRLENQSRFSVSPSQYGFKHSHPIAWWDGAYTYENFLYRDQANTHAVRNSTNAQTFRIYNTTDSGIANYERAKLAWESNTFVIGTEIAGTSVTPRNIAFTGGNVGIGTTSPSYLLDVAGQARFGKTGVAGLINLARSSDGVTVGSIYTGGSGGSHLFVDSPGGDVRILPGSVDALIVKVGGNIGIGLTSPAAKLDISDTTSAGSGSLAASTLNIASTWNTTGTPTLIKANVTDTASNAASLLMDLQVGSVSKFKVQKNGLVILSGNPFIGTSSTVGYGINGDGSPSVVVNSSERMSVSASRLFLSNDANFGIAFSAGAAYQNDTVILRDGAAHTLAMRYGNIAQTFRLYGTHTDSNNYRRLSLSGTTAGAFTISAEGAGTGASGNTLRIPNLNIGSGTFSNDALIPLEIVGNSLQYFGYYVKNETSTTGGYKRIGIGVGGSNAPVTEWVNRSYVEDQTYGGLSLGCENGHVRIYGSRGANALFVMSTGLVSFAGMTSSFPAIKRNGTAINFRLADDSADAPITASQATLSTGTITASTPALDISQTWNSSGVTFTGSKINITDTASASGSLLADWQVGGVSKLKIRKDGRVYSGDGSTSYLALTNDNGAALVWSGSSFSAGANATITSNNIGLLTSGVIWLGSTSTHLYIDSVRALGFRNSSNPYAIRIYNTSDADWTVTNNYERGVLDWQTTSNVFRIGTEAAGTGTVRNIALVGGNVGIGTTSPSAKLHITNGGLFVDHDYNSVSVPGGGMLGMYLRGNSGVSPFGFSAASTGNISASAPLFYYSWIAATKLGFASYDGSSANQFIAFDYTSKNIGISNTSPAAKLDISDTTSAGSGSLAASTLNIASTWNTSGTPTLIKATVTDTASNANSKLFSLEKNTTNAAGEYWRFFVKQNGETWTTGDLYTGLGLASGARISVGGGFYTIGQGSGLSCHSSIINLLVSENITLCRDASAILGQRSGTTAQTYRLYGTYSDASNYERLALSSTTYSSAKYATIAAESAGTGAANINMVVSPKGAGAFMLRVPDGTGTGGNARGQYAVDLQMLPGTAPSVASGNYSSVVGGEGNSASGSWTVVGGRSCSATADYATVIGGRSCSASNQYAAMVGGYSNSAAYMATVAGGRENTASANYSAITGGWNGLADRPFQRAFGANKFSSQGDAQESRFILKKKTTDATAATLLLPDDTSRLTIPSGKVFAFVAKISGIKSDGSAVAFYTRKGCIKNVGGTTSLVGSIETIGTDTEDNAATDVAITADDTNDALQINVTGIAAETWRWVAVVEGIEIGYGA